MNEEYIFEKLTNHEIAVNFTDIDSFRIFCGFLTSKGVNRKNPTQYYWEKYGKSLCVTLTEIGNFKCGSRGFYESAGKEIYTYEKLPYVVNIL